jgi:quercetin dioxygenase-like cupin family protein
METSDRLVGPVETREFELQMRRDGFEDLQIRIFGPTPVNNPHVHPFDVRGIVLAGEAVITCDGVAGTYRKGDRFEMKAGVSHTEAYGPNGYRWLVGKRFLTTA